MPKIAIVYYSKSGHSQLIAERLSTALGADVFALHTPRYGTPFFGYFRAGIDSLRRTRPPLAHPLPDIGGFDVAVLCGPIWTSYPAAPLISYMRQARNLPPVLGLMLTCGDHSPPEKAFAMAEVELGRGFQGKAAIGNSIENEPKAQDGSMIS
ncbi:hypothetical protein QTO30_12570 [Yoonia sp. GPGPB17]|uniref:hypothetical protein n=1 Tax=Yoonia sp. GPGPB17 TaxID=3026147 RepID=UPI0030BCDC33